MLALALDDKLKIIIGENHVFISSFELQTPYNLYLGSNKDIEDAVYLWDIFKEKVDTHLLKRFMNATCYR